MKLLRESKFSFQFFFLATLYLPLPVLAQDIFNSYITVNGDLFEEPVWVEFYSEEQKSKNKVQLEPVLDSLSKVFSESLLSRIKQNLNTEGQLSFEALNKMGVETSLDLGSLDLTLNVKKEDKKLTEVSVSGVGSRQREGDVLGSSVLSGYLNLRGAGEIFGSNREDLATNNFTNSSSLSAEAVLNIGGVALESHYLYSDNQNTVQDRWSRLYSRIVVDDQRNSIRYTLGDLNHDIRGFQEILLGAGLGVHKEFSIQPNFFRSSFKKHTIYLDTDSVIEIFVNGDLVKRETAPQGPVKLSDFPFNAGENEVSVRVTDRLGNIKDVSFSDINDTRLLAVGMSDYSFNLLYLRKDDGGLDVSLEESYLEDKPTFTGFYHVGAYKNLVSGVDLQYNEDRFLLGLETLYGDTKGIVKLNLAGSSDKATSTNGLGLRLEYESLFFKKGALSSFRFFSSLEHRSEEFVEFLSGVSNLKYRGRASVGQNFKNSIRASLGVVKDWFNDDSNSQTFITSNFGWTIFKNLDFSSNVRVNLQNGDDTTVLLSLNWHSRQNNQQLTSTYDPIANVASSELVSFPLKGRQNFRTYVGGEYNDSAKRLTAGVDFFNQRFESRAAHTSSVLDSGGRDNTTRLNVGMALVFAGAKVAVSKPVENAFALISMKDKPWSYSVPINKGVNSQRGEINFWGPAVITNITPYYTDRAALDISNLPYGYSLDQEAFQFKPSYKSGLHIRAKVDGEVSLSGRAVYPDGRSAEYITAYVYESLAEGKRGKLVGQAFTGADGAFNIEKIEPKKYILSFEGEDLTYKDVQVSVKSKIGVYELKKDVVLER